jgi:lipoate-protein ligase A
MSFTLINAPSPLAQDARFDETLIMLAGQGQPVASVWQSRQSLVVPRTYANRPEFDTACGVFAAKGWPVSVRLSGGGIVPQGPGIINVSLAYEVQGKPMDHTADAYLKLCAIISDALSHWQIDAYPAAVQGSFCDGRYNLALGADNDLQKVAGTAQVWRRSPRHQPDSERHCVLVHALVLAAVDTVLVTQVANDFEAATAGRLRYQAQRIASLHTCAHASEVDPAGFVQALCEKLEQRLLRPEAEATPPIDFGQPQGRFASR